MKKVKKDTKKRRISRLMAVILSLCMVLQMTYLPVQAQEVQPEEGAEVLANEASLLDTVRQAAQADFNAGNNGEAKSVDLNLRDHVFDGTDAGVIDYTSDEFGGADSPYLQVLENLRTSQIGGTLIIRFKTASSGIMFAAGSSDDNNGTNMIAGINSGTDITKRFRLCIRNNVDKGLQANFTTAPVTDNQWHTMAITFRPGETENAYLSLDGGDNLYNPGWWAKWVPGFHAENAGVAGEEHPYVNFRVGKAVNDSFGQDFTSNFNGSIDFITISDQSFTADELKELTQPFIDKYAVTFAGGEGAEGAAPEAADAAEGDKLSLPQNPFTKAGYVFAGWNDGTKVYQPGEEYTMGARAVAFTAEWRSEDCTCAISDLVFNGQAITIEEDQANAEVTLAAAAKRTGDCQVAGHSDNQIAYTFEEADDPENIGSVSGNKLTVTKSGTIKVRVNAAISGTAAAASEEAEFQVEKKAGQDPAVVFKKSEVKIVNGVPTQEVDYTGALDKLKDLSEGTITVRYKAENSGLMSLFSVSDNTQPATHAHVYISGSKVGYEVHKQAEKINDDSVSVSNAELNQWHTVTYVFSDTNTKIYYDGEKVKENTQKGFISSCGGVNTVDLGKTDRSDSNNEYLFSGSINSIEVRSDLLTEEQILERQQVTVREEKEAVLPENVRKTDDMKLMYGGYENSVSYRIPSIITTDNGVLIAAIDKRQSGSADQGNIDTMIRRSFDNGKTWTDGQVVFNMPAGQEQHSLTIDSVMVKDEETGRIFLMADMFPESRAAMGADILETGSGYKRVGDKDYCILRDYEGVLDKTHNYTTTYTIREHGEVWLEGNTEADARPTDYSVPDFSTGKLYKDDQPAGNIFLYTGTNAGELKVVRNMRIWSIYSDDDGETWSKPRDLTPMIKEDWMLFFGTGPGVGVQVKKGAHAGRLIIPIYVANSAFDPGQASECIYSDDHGVTWERTKTSPLEAAGFDLPTMDNRNAVLTESQLVEMNDGTLVQFFRNRSGSLKYSVSADSGTTWGAPVIDAQVPETYCQLTAVHYPMEIDGKEAVILANPSGPSRNNGKVRIGLYDPEKKTFDWKYDQFINQGAYAYSCLSVLPNGDIGLFYEADVPDMMFTSFNTDWIMADLTVPSAEPVITNVSCVKGDGTIDFTVDFDSYMVKTGSPVLKFSMDGIEKEAAYVSGGGTRQFVFRYEGNTDVQERLAVTNVGVAAGDAVSEIGNAMCMLPADAEFVFGADGTPECTCKIEGLSLEPSEIVIPADAAEKTEVLNGSMKSSNCAKQEHTFNPAYTYTVVDEGTTGAVLDGESLKVTGTGTVQIRVDAELNGKTANDTFNITVRKADPGEVVNKAPEAKDPVPTVQVTSLEGAVISAENIAADPDGDTLTITKIVSKPADSIMASLKDGKVTLFGSIATTSQMMVNVSDGEKTATIIVPIEVTESGAYDKTDYLSNHDFLDRSQSTVGWGSGPKKDVNEDEGTMSLLDESGNAVYFLKGYSAHCSSKMVFNLPTDHSYTKFESYYGIDASKSPVAKVTFKVKVDGVEKHVSTADMQSTSPMGFVSVDITGASTLTLEATANGGNGSGHTEWAGAALVSKDAGASIDKTVLEAQVQEALAYQQSDYSPASYALLQEAIAAAQETISSAEKQIEVFKQMQEVKAAVDALDPSLPAEEVILSNQTMSMAAGDSRKLYADLKTKDGGESNDEVVWTTSNEKVAAVSAAGKVTAAAIGTAVITATATSGKSASCTITVGDVQYTAQFKGGDGATGTAPSTLRAEAGKTIKLPANTFTKTGYDFTGWNDGSKAYAAGASYTMPAKNVEFTAEWKKQEAAKYTAEFKGGDGATGTAPAALTAEAGKTIKLPANTFTKTGYDFTGWNDGSKVYAADASYTMSAKNVEFTAEWKKQEAAKYTAEFKGGDGATGTAPLTVKTEAGNTISLPSNTFTRTGYDFAGWNDGSKVYAAKASYTMPAKDVVFTASWKKQEAPKPIEITISFDARGGSTSTVAVKVNQGSPYGTLPTPVRAGYRFNGWFTEINGGLQIKTGDTCSLQASTWVYAQWTKLAPAAPGKVTGLKASGNRYNMLKLSWNKVSGAKGYRIYRYDSKTREWNRIKTTGGTSYTNNKKMKAGTSYKYKVYAYNTIGGTTKYGPASAILKTGTAPVKPRLLSAKKTGTRKVTVKWKKPAKASGIAVYMKTGNGSYSRIAFKSAKKTSYTYSSKAFKKGKVYTFRLRAYNTVGGKKIYSKYSGTRRVRL